MFSEGTVWQWRAIFIAFIGFVDFMYRELFPEWWYWGRWAGQFADELSEEVIEFTGILMLGCATIFLGISLMPQLDFRIPVWLHV